MLTLARRVGQVVILSGGTPSCHLEVTVTDTTKETTDIIVYNKITGLRKAYVCQLAVPVVLDEARQIIVVMGEKPNNYQACLRFDCPRSINIVRREVLTKMILNLEAIDRGEITKDNFPKSNRTKPIGQ